MMFTFNDFNGFTFNDLNKSTFNDVNKNPYWIVIDGWHLHKVEGNLFHSCGRKGGLVVMASNCSYCVNCNEKLPDLIKMKSEFIKARI